MMIQEKNQWEDVIINNDFVFCRVMKVEEICNELLETLL